MEEEKPDDLASIFSELEQKLGKEANAVREAFSHNGSAGTGLENIVKAFLSKLLPQKIGIVSGEAIDSNGHRSRQLDLILYDKNQMPVFMYTEFSDMALVPVEAILGVIEVKTTLTVDELKTCCTNCQSIKKLSRVAYRPQPIERKRTMGGREWNELPIYYSVFAVNSRVNDIAGKLDDIQIETAFDRRIDSLICLNQEVDLNAEINLCNADIQPLYLYRCLDNDDVLVGLQTKYPLVLWFVSLFTALTEYNLRPLDLVKYIPAESVNITSTFNSKKAIEKLLNKFRKQAEMQYGLSDGVLGRVFAHEGSLDDVYEILRTGKYRIKDATPENVKRILAEAVIDSREMSRQEWAQKIRDTGKGDEFKAKVAKYGIFSF
ncbi:hypothetical protein PT282_04660 [Bifidobacterium sp. ESL0763]|uniref:DUF6602 domain-containing protein n=1 Tax=Bifidobacterium sp. ESL0763 TaxID=2983227 RepID=UPI0023F6DAED|nr:DUF6602 domain-containing protein [Bifidobacterium sp. ESL0763]MDF7663955.1 hypothetical protein [Bifidobacterium sp. ESL0763]